MNRTFEQVLHDLHEELTDYCIPLFSVPGFVVGPSPDEVEHDDEDWRGVLSDAVRVCEHLLASDDIELVWMQGHYDKPAPFGGPRPFDRPVPRRVAPDHFYVPGNDLLTPLPYLAIDRVSSG